MSIPVVGEARTLDDLSERLTELRLQVGSPSYSEIARRVGEVRVRRGVRTIPPGRVTVYDVFRTGRSRMDIELVADIVTVLGRAEDVPAWRRAHAAALRRRAQERTGRVSAARGDVRLVRDADDPADPGTAPAHDRELHEIVTELLERRERGGAPATVISGLPGVGKSTLAQAVVAEVSRRIGEMIIVHASMTSHSESDGKVADPADIAQKVLRARDTAQNDTGQLVLLLDDVGTLDALAVVTSALPDGAIVVATSRHALDDSEIAAVHVIHPLDPARAGRLLKTLIETGDEPDDTVARLVELSGGLALSIALLAGQILSQEGWSLEDHVARLEASSPAGLAPALLAAYDQLPAAPRRALELLARHPGRLRTPEAAIYLQDTTADMDAAIDTILRAHFISRAPDGGIELNGAVRALASQRALTDIPLSARRSAAVRLGHELRAHVHDIELDPESVARFDDEADVHVTTALLYADLGLADEFVDSARTLYPWLQTTGRWGDIVLINEHARRLASGDERRVAEMRMAEGLIATGRLDEAEAILTAQVSAARPGPGHYWTLALLATVADRRGDSRRCVELCEIALPAAQQAGNRHAMHWIAQEQAEMLIEMGRAEQAVSILEPLVSEEWAADPPLSRVPTLIQLGITFVWLDRLDDARTTLARASAEAMAIGHPAMAASCSGWAGLADALRGNVAAGRSAVATADADAALEASARPGPRAWARLAHAAVCLRDGDDVTAERLARDGLNLAHVHGFPTIAAYGRVLLARVVLRDGRVAEAEDLLAAMADVASLNARALGLIVSADIAAHTGDAGLAGELLQAARELGPTPLVARRLRWLT